MPIELLQRALQKRPNIATPNLPASGAVGLALPLAALGVVLVGMDLHLLGLLAWTVAIALIAFVLGRLYAVAVIGTVTLCGILLWRMLLGSALNFSGTEQMTFLLITALAAIVGQLGAAELRQRETGAADKFNLAVFASAIESIFEGSSDCIKLLAIDGSVLAVNNRGLQLIGASDSNQLIGQSWFSFWDSEQQKALAAAWQLTLRSGQAEFEGGARILTGERRHWRSTFTLVRTPDAAQSYIICISRDITDKVAMQQSLKASAAQLSGLLNGIDDAFFSLDANWTITFANQHSEHLYARLGHTSVLGSNFWDVFPVAPGEPVAIYIRRAMEQQSVQRCEYFHAPQQVWLSITALPFPNGISVLVRDITPLKRAEKHAAEENARLQVAQDIAGFGDWAFDYEHGLMRFSPRAVALLELEECPQHEYKKRLLERLHAEDRMALVQAIINSSAEAPRIDLVVRMPTANGGEKHLHWVGQLIVDERGGALRMLGAIQDVSAHLGAQKALDDARRFVRDLLDALPQYIFVIDRNGHFVTGNNTWEQVWCDHFASDSIPDNFFNFDHKLEGIDRAIAKAANEAAHAILSGASERFEYEYDMLMEGERHYFVMHAVPLRSAGETMVLFTHSEITSVKQLMHTASTKEHLMHRLAEHLPEIFWTYDINAGVYTHLSPAFDKLYRIPAGTVANSYMTLLEFAHPDDQPKLVQAMLALTEGRNEDTAEYRIINADGELRWLKTSSVAVRDDDNRLTDVIGITRDITDSKLYEQQLIAAAHTDDLTGLSNRKALMALLDKNIAQAREKPFALLLLNLDRFKNINDTLGHSGGDELLKQSANRLRAALPDNVMLARVGSDEFAIVCDEAKLQAIIDATMACFVEAFHLQGEPAFVTASLGATRCPRDSADNGELLKFAGAALQRAKAKGRNNNQLFEDSMLLPSRERLALENELRLALQHSEFELFYQGKFDLGSGALIGAEALLRWRSQKRGLVSPIDFIPLLEETGLILPVGDWILADACRQVLSWRERSGTWLPVAVNVSALQVTNRAFAEKAIAILQEKQLPRGTIELEITESALMTDANYGAHLIKTLKAAGFSIALDDFGTGYSSLGYLRKFLPSTLKIDRSFVAELTAQSNDQQIVGGIVQLAKALSIDVIAEGIESADQRTILCGLGCLHGQGFLFGRPLPAQQFEQSAMHVASAQTPVNVKAAN